jgi:S-adenosylmethionine:tRNA ribosyltransferase-isomerase
VELFILEEVAAGEWDVLLRARRRPKPGERIVFAGGQASAVMLADGELGRARVRIESSRPLLELAVEYGETPLPPYVQRPEAGEQGPEGGGRRGEDAERYQTVYARYPGAVAAPTAGLHFTPEVLEKIAARGTARAEITLHVGIGTFRPVTAEQVDEHRMESERFEISAEAASRIRSAKRVVAVGSTSVRTLEYVAATRGGMESCEGRVDLFIRPAYEFRIVGAMLTNFHLPKSTLLMMVSALAGREFILRAYEEAVRERYRFFSYGDCMLIL